MATRVLEPTDPDAITLLKIVIAAHAVPNGRGGWSIPDRAVIINDFRALRERYDLEVGNPGRRQWIRAFISSDEFRPAYNHLISDNAFAEYVNNQYLQFIPLVAPTPDLLYGARASRLRAARRRVEEDIERATRRPRVESETEEEPSEAASESAAAAEPSAHRVFTRRHRAEIMHMQRQEQARLARLAAEEQELERLSEAAARLAQVPSGFVAPPPPSIASSAAGSPPSGVYEVEYAEPVEDRSNTVEVAALGPGPAPFILPNVQASRPLGLVVAEYTPTVGALPETLIVGEAAPPVAPYIVRARPHEPLPALPLPTITSPRIEPAAPAALNRVAELLGVAAADAERLLRRETSATRAREILALAPTAVPNAPPNLVEAGQIAARPTSNPAQYSGAQRATNAELAQLVQNVVNPPANQPQRPAPAPQIRADLREEEEESVEPTSRAEAAVLSGRNRLALIEKYPAIYRRELDLYLARGYTLLEAQDIALTQLQALDYNERTRFSNVKREPSTATAPPPPPLPVPPPPATPKAKKAAARPAPIPVGSSPLQYELLSDADIRRRAREAAGPPPNQRRVRIVEPAQNPPYRRGNPRSVTELAEQFGAQPIPVAGGGPPVNRREARQRRTAERVATTRLERAASTLRNSWQAVENLDNAAETYAADRMLLQNWLRGRSAAPAIPPTAPASPAAYYQPAAPVNIYNYQGGAIPPTGAAPFPYAPPVAAPYLGRVAQYLNLRNPNHLGY